MITEQQLIAQMNHVMTEIEQSNGETQKRHVAKLMGYCELLLADPTVSSPSVQPSAPVTVAPAPDQPPLDRQMAAFLGIPLEEDEEPKTDSLLDF